jgi:peptidoglycan/xylan/chitin deacetylase (PgdA/CDA1 family)
MGAPCSGSLYSLSDRATKKKRERFDVSGKIRSLRKCAICGGSRLAEMVIFNLNFIMFSVRQHTGTSLPKHTLCLTFDDGPGQTESDVPGQTESDGPGPKTIRLAEYLHGEGISGTFFMVGAHINKYPDVPGKVAALGHIVGNHTYHHLKPLPQHLRANDDIVGEIESTDDLIREYNPDNKIYFRAPWASWSPKVAEKLNKDLHNGLDHIGPYCWDIESNDWKYWNEMKAAEECAAAFIKKVEKVKRGIVLMHDSTVDLALARDNNRTYETVKILIPELKRRGYRFVGLNEVRI